jgi:lipopolysaccharide biosynthesis glycosyltransferase
MTIPVIFACDHRYAMPCSVAITSLLATRGPHTTYDVRVLAGDVSADDCRRLTSLSAGPNTVTIVTAEPQHAIPEYQAAVDGHSYLSAAAFLRFHAPELLPDIDKAVYLDADVIVQADLTALFETNLTHAYAGVVRALSVLELSQGLRNPVAHPYFNSGMLVMNLARMRTEHIGERLRQETIRHHFPCHDQDALNYVFGGKVCWLSPTYNYCTTYDVLCTAHEAAAHFSIPVREWYAIHRNPVILHYIFDKPWHYRQALRASDWRHHFARSPYRDCQLEYRHSARVLLTALFAAAVPQGARRFLRNTYVRVRYPAVR